MITKSLEDWLQKLETSHDKKIDLGLERITQVYNALDLDKVAPMVITVAGTNGKGSTVAILSSICQQAHYKVGIFTSPHIIKFNERIKINDIEVDDDLIINAFELVEINLKGISLSYFEYATLAALIIFKQQKVDICVLEVGLGGRLDSVNVVDTDCAIITTIDIDHTAWLGDTKEAIGLEKAGIIRSNKPVIYGDVDCPQSIISKAQEVSADLIFACQQQIDVPELNIQGSYQVINAKTAITALMHLSGFEFNQIAINKGLKNINLQGRLQVVSNKPTVIVDVSHNKQAGKCLAQWLQSNPISGKTIAVFAVLADKNPIDWLGEFSNVVDLWCISQVRLERAMPKQELVMLLANNASLITSHETVSVAFDKAKLIADKIDRIIVFGSFYTVSEVLIK